MLRVAFALVTLAILRTSAEPSRRTPVAWPHRALLTSLHRRPVAFRAYTLGGDFIITVDASGHRVVAAASARIRHLTVNDTIRAETPADFPLDLSKGPVVFVAEGDDSMHLVVGRNPYGNVSRVSANGRKFTVRLVRDHFVIESR
jgi:hypothetical protein